MVTLQDEDNNRLTKILLNESLRSPNLITSILSASGMQQLIPVIDLTGTPNEQIPKLISFLEKYGKVAYGQDALGKFLSFIKSSLNAQDKKYVDKIIRKYNLITLYPEILRILFLSANPYSGLTLNLINEFNHIEDLLMTTHREQFDLVQHHAISKEDLLKIINRYKPHILHLSGRGTGQQLIAFKNQEGEIVKGDPSFLASIFKVENSVRCVVLNACGSEEQAKAISSSVGCTVSIPNTLDEDAAARFIARFYELIADGKSVQSSFKNSNKELTIYLESRNEPAADLPRLDYLRESDPFNAFRNKKPRTNETYHDQSLLKTIDKVNDQYYKVLEGTESIIDIFDNIRPVVDYLLKSEQDKGLVRAANKKELGAYMRILNSRIRDFSREKTLGNRIESEILENEIKLNYRRILENLQDIKFELLSQKDVSVNSRS